MGTAYADLQPTQHASSNHKLTSRGWKQSPVGVRSCDNKRYCRPGGLPLFHMQIELAFGKQKVRTRHSGHLITGFIQAPLQESINTLVNKTVLSETEEVALSL
jgi:hypothetical protein